MQFICCWLNNWACTLRCVFELRTWKRVKSGLQIEHYGFANSYFYFFIKPGMIANVKEAVLFTEGRNHPTPRFMSWMSASFAASPEVLAPLWKLDGCVQPCLHLASGTGWEEQMCRTKQVVLRSQTTLCAFQEGLCFATCSLFPWTAWH